MIKTVNKHSNTLQYKLDRKNNIKWLAGPLLGGEKYLVFKNVFTTKTKQNLHHGF